MVKQAGGNAFIEKGKLPGLQTKSPLEETGSLKYSDFSLAELLTVSLAEMLLPVPCRVVFDRGPELWAQPAFSCTAHSIVDFLAAPPPSLHP